MFVRMLGCFNSRTPGGVRQLEGLPSRSLLHVSIHAPREGCDESLPTLRHSMAEVSIHAPREGCDGDSVRLHGRHLGVSIHAPREGCDVEVFRGATGLSGFNSRTPGGVRRRSSPERTLALWFQFTHPGRGATKPLGRLSHAREFQFTHPGRGATGRIHYSEYTDKVSIHAPREGCDLGVLRCPLDDRFQFTHPGRGATVLS